MNSKNILLYAIRGGCCILVILIHCKFPEFIGTEIIAVARIAVPFFFMVSGYYVHADNKQDTSKRISKQIMKLLELTCITVILYFIINTFVCLLTDVAPFAWLIAALNFKDILRFFVFNRAAFLAAIAWYLFAMLYICAIMKFLLHSNLIRLSYSLAPILLIGNIVVGEVLGSPWYYTGNFLLTGLPFYLIGFYFRTLDFRKIPKLIPAFGLVAGLIISMVEAYFKPDVYVYVGTIISVVSLFLCGLFYRIDNYRNFLAIIGEQYSTTIFIIHCAIIKLLDMIMIDTLIWSWIKPIIVISISIAIAFFVKNYLLPNNTKQRG